MSESNPLETNEKTEKDRAFDKLVSAFIGLAMDLIESGEAEAILKGKRKFTYENRTFFEKPGVAKPVFLKNTGKKRRRGESSGFELGK